MKKIENTPNNPRILLARGDALGDVVCSTVVIKQLKKRYPDCQIFYLIKPNYISLLKDIPEIEGFIEDNLPYYFDFLKLLKAHINDQLKHGFLLLLISP